MSPGEVGGPSGPFVQAVCAAALTATAMLGVAVWFEPAAPAPPFPFIVLSALIASALLAALAAAFIGLPLTWLMARRGREAPWTYPLAGLVAGGVLMAGLARIGLGGEARPADERLEIVSLGAVPGLVCGIIWWRLYRRYFQPGSAE